MQVKGPAVGAATGGALLLALGLLLALAQGCEDEPTPPPPPPVDDGFHDPLSMPVEPTLSPASFKPASACQTCHPTHYAEWRTSMHAYSMVDPVFRALVGVRQADYDGAQDPFCVQCHSAIATRGGEIVPGFDFASLPPIALEGIGCEACHKVSQVVRPYNAGHLLDEDGPQRGPIDDPQIDVSNHATTHAPIFGESLFCGACHDVVEVSGLQLERPYGEWLESPSFTAGDTCQSCHMPGRQGQAADGGPNREVHDHRFIGVDVPLADDFANEAERELIRAGVVELLDGAATLDLAAPTSVSQGAQLDLLVSVKNEIPGHNLPTGSTFIRELWVEVTATDGDGTVLYRTGDLDDNGDLRHHFSALDPYGDHDLLVFGATLIDPDGQPILFPWRAAELRSTAIPPLYRRSYTLFVPTGEAAAGPITIQARLRFRSHGPYLLRALGLDELVEKVAIYDIATATTTVDLVAP
ncbi:MAG: cytochrome c family protein [Polyangiaceae bacterium]